MIYVDYTGSVNISHQYSAVEDGYEGGDPIGYGATEQEATNDLLDKLNSD